MTRRFANEAHFHQELIDNIAAFPVELRGSPDAHLFVWAHELTLHDAGVGGGNGSADLLTVDRSGLVWLIEVKFNYSLESGERVWGDQLLRYRNALMSMHWHDIVRYTRKFLIHRERTRPQFAHQPDIASLEACVAEWLAALGDDSALSATIVSGMAAQLRSGSFGIMLVSDYFSLADYQGAVRFAENVHDGPVAYSVVETEEKGFHWHLRFFKAAGPEIAIIHRPVDSSFTSDVMPRGYLTLRLLDVGTSLNE